jgi:mannitol/fructose-specific phosphotransferase system IIA component
MEDQYITMLDRKEIINVILGSCINIIHVLHAGEGNMNIHSPKSIIFPEGNARVEYDTRG